MARQTQQLSDAIDDYDRFRRSMDISPGTLKGQRSTLARLLAVNGNIWMHALNESHVTRFFEVAGKTKQGQSLRNDYTHLSGFFGWARQTGRMARDADPLYGRRRPKRVRRERNRLDVSQFPLLLDTAGERCPRDRALVALLLYTLGRDGEVADLRIRDVDINAGYIMYRVFKTHEEDRVPICAELDQELRAWLTEYTKRVGFLESSYYLLPARQVRGVKGASGVYESVEDIALRPEKKIQGLGKIVGPILESMGFPVRDENGRGLGEGAHTIRRSGARALFNRLVADGYDGALRVVQSMLHHSSSAQTEAYLGITADRRTRDDLIKGRRLYDVGSNVIELRGSGNGQDDADRGAVRSV